MDIECTFRAINQTLRLEKTRLEARGRAAAPTEANAVTVFLAEEDSGRAGPGRAGPHLMNTDESRALFLDHSHDTWDILVFLLLRLVHFV